MTIRKGEIKIDGAKIEAVQLPGRPYSFILKPKLGQEDYAISAHTEEEREAWMDAIVIAQVFLSAAWTRWKILGLTLLS